MVIFVNTIWIASGIAAVAAVIQIVRVRLSSRFPCLLSCLSVLALRSISTIWMAPSVRQAVMSFSMPIVVAVQAFAILEMHGQLTSAYRNFDQARRVFLAIAAVIGIGASVVAHNALPMPWDFPLDVAVSLERDAMLVMATALGWSWLFLRMTSDTPVPKIAQRGGAILTAQAVAATIVYSVAPLVHYNYWASAVAPLSADLLISLAWILWFAPTPQTSTAMESRQPKLPDLLNDMEILAGALARDLQSETAAAASVSRDSDPRSAAK